MSNTPNFPWGLPIRLISVFISLRVLMGPAQTNCLGRLTGGGLFLYKASLWRLGEVADLSNVQTPTQRKMKKQADIFWTKEQDKSPETYPNEMEIDDLPDREFKITITKILTKVKRIMHRQSKKFNKDIKNIEGTKQKSWTWRI